VALLDFQTALGRLVRVPDGADPLRSLRLDAAERSCLQAMTQSSAYRFTVAVQRSWCVGRAKRAGQLTLSILPAATRRRLLDEWIDAGGGTSSFAAAETDALLNFVANRLPDPSHELTICRFEQATVRANEGAMTFTAPAPIVPAASPCVVRRGRHAGLAAFHAEPHQILAVPWDRKSLPPVLPEPKVIMLFGPGFEQLCRPASAGDMALWERLTAAVEVPTLWREGHRRDDVETLLRAGVVEYGD